MKKVLTILLLLCVVFAQAQPQLPSYLPSNGLVGWWPFNGNAKDESGNGNNGTVNGATLTTDRNGSVGKAYSFYTSNGGGNIQLSGLSLGDKFSISCWVRLNEFNSTNVSSIISRYPSSGVGYELNIDNPAGLRGIYGLIGPESDSKNSIISKNQFNLNVWGQIVWIKNGSYSAIYKNGVIVYETNSANITGPNSGITYFGRAQWGGNPFKGVIDDIAIYNRALSQDEITALYTGKPAGCFADIINKDTTICKGASVKLTATGEGGSLNAKDVDGNVYPAVNIGAQTWTQKNLNVTRYRNGDIIPQVTDPTQWLNLKTGAWCYWNNDQSTEPTYGKLYNWYAVNDPRGLAPEGWKVANSNDWNVMVDYLGGPSVAGGKIKETGTAHFVSPNLGATNISGFTALPAGVRMGIGESSPGQFYGMPFDGVFWTSTPIDVSLAQSRAVTAFIESTFEMNDHKTRGASVRVMKSNSYTYLWSNGATTPTIDVSPTQTTKYYVTVSDGINSCRDSVTVTVNDCSAPCIADIINKDTTICRGASVKLTATPNNVQPKIPVPSTLWLVGNINGWNNSASLETKYQLSKIGETTFAGIFNFQGGGSYKLIRELGNWNTQYRAIVDGNPLSGQFEQSNNDPGFQEPFIPGWYRITVDFQTATYTVTPSTERVETPANLYIVGTLNGWNNSPSLDPKYTFTKADQFKYTLDVDFAEGGLYKLIQDLGNWSTQFHRNSGDALFGEFVQRDADPAFLNPETPGRYRITVDFAANYYWLKKITTGGSIPTNGLVGYWPFNGNANDESGNGNNGTVNGATLTTDRFGAPGRAYSFNGLDNLISIPNSNSLNIAGKQISISMWINSNNDLNDNKYKGISKGGYLAGSGYEFIFRNSYLGDNGTMQFTAGGPGYYAYGTTNYNINAESSKWFHTAAVLNNGKISIYINGVLQKEDVVGFSTLLSNNSPLLIGTRDPANDLIGYLKGKLDDIRIYNRALTPNEVAALATEGNNLTYLWSNGATTPTIDVSPTQTTKYYVTVSDGINSCKDSVTVTVNDCSAPCIADIINKDTTICKGATLKLTASGSSGVTNVKDIEGNQYPVVKIGTQYWMGANLRTAKFSDGGNIKNIIDGTEWYLTTNTLTPAWSSIGHDQKLDSTRGKLYNWYAVNDSRNVCPVGWHVPNESEWDTLIYFLDSKAMLNVLGTQSTIAGAGLKDTLNYMWNWGNVGATNSTGFSARPAGIRGYYGNFYNGGDGIFLWTSSENGQYHAYYRGIDAYSTSVGRGTTQGIDNKSVGGSVRCLKNKENILNTYTYLWSTGATSPTIDVSPTQTTKYYLTVSDGINSCRDSVTVTVTQPVTPTFTQVTAKCQGSSFTLPTISTNGVTGTWSPAINTQTTTTYTFTPTQGLCANTTTMSVTVNPKVTPTFTQVASVCQGTSFTLPTTSTNGVTGTWSPAINTQTTTTYTFTPTQGLCANTATMTVTVNNLNTAGVASSEPTLCVNTPLTNITHATTHATGIGAATGLPAGVTAAWANNTITISGTPTASGTFNYTIPLTGGCGTVSATGRITVSPRVTPSFTQVATVCQGTTFTLPTTSTNGVTGAWSPAINTQTTTTYTFTPSQGQCANTTTMRVEIKSCNPLTLTISNVNGICGNTVDVPVSVAGFKSIVSMQGSINWNPADLKYELISNYGPASLALGIGNFGLSQTTQGRLTFSWNDANVAGITLPDNTPIYTIRFTALGNQTATKPITISNTPTPIEFVDATLQKKDIVQVNGSVIQKCVSIISGRLLTPLQQPVKNATVSRSGSGTPTTATTDANGNYSFSVVPGSYTLTPSKNNEINRTNGVSTLDIALIQSHVLQRNLLNSPYKIIAADVNGTNTVTSLDLLFIRRFILGYQSSFPGNRTWAFVPQDQVFANPLNPFPYPASKTVSALNDAPNTNFIGLKLGDVNYDRNPQLDRPINGTQPLRLYYEEENINDNETILHVRVKEGRMLMGTQFTLNWDAGKYNFGGVVSNQLGISTGDNWQSEGVLALSWNDEQAQGVMLTKDMELFSIRLTRNANISQSASADILSLGTDKLEQEAFDASYKNMGIVLERKLSSDEIITDKRMRIYPNPAVSKITVDVAVNYNGKGEIRLLDVLGRVVYTKAVDVRSGNNVYNLQLPRGKVKSGTYVVKLITGTEQQVGKIVVE